MMDELQLFFFTTILPTFPILPLLLLLILLFLPPPPPMAGKTMQAVQYNAYGGGTDGLQHVEVPIPSQNKDEVLLKLEATALNPVDWKIQKGMLRPFFPSKFPFIPAFDVAGEVVELGPGVDSLAVGDKVIALLNFPNGGGLAEYAVSPVALTVRRPPEVSPAEGAGLPSASLTALQALKLSDVRFDGTINKTMNVLITAASGGVGLYAVQLAKIANLHVTATCGARNMELVKSLGADEVLDYKTPEGASLKSPSGLKYDAIIHCAAGIDWSVFDMNLTTHGIVVDMTPGMRVMISAFIKKVMFSKKKLVTLMLAAKGEDLKYVVELAKEGKIKTVVDSKHPLGKVGDAWEKSMSGHATGKVIVEI